jgi:hypothetical protein
VSDSRDLSPDERRVEDALRLWKDDATRAAGALDPERVLARAWRTARSDARAAPSDAALASASRRYVRAAAVLLALGAGGTAWIAAAEGPGDAARARTLDTLETERLALQRVHEVMALRVVRPATEGDSK